MNYLASLNAFQLMALVAMGIGVVGFLFVNRGAVGTFLSRFKPSGGTTVTPPPVSTDDDTLDFQAHGRLHKRFTRLECKEGLEACSVQLQHFYHGAEDHK